MANEELQALAALQIAQAKFKQGLRKPADGLASLDLEQATEICNALDAAFAQETTENIQVCKDWIIRHIAPSKARIALLGDYLISLSKSNIVNREKNPDKALRNRLVPLSVLSDVMLTVKCPSPQVLGFIVADLQPCIEELVGLIASCLHDKRTKIEAQLMGLTKFWESTNVIAPEGVAAIRKRAVTDIKIAQGDAPPETTKREYTLPEFFGDQNAQWHDLPTSYMLDSLTKHPNRPVDRHDIRIRRFNNKYASKEVCDLIDQYFERRDSDYVPNVDNPTGESDKYEFWLDSMGQLVKETKETGEVATVSNGYGWSIKLSEDMQELGVPENIHRAREEYRSSRMDVDSPPRSERPRSGSQSSSQSYSRSRSRGRSRPNSSGYGCRTRPRRDYQARSRSRSRSPYDAREDNRRSRFDREDYNHNLRPPPYPNSQSHGAPRYNANPQPPNFQNQDAYFNRPFHQHPPPPPPPPPPYVSGTQSGFPPPPPPPPFAQNHGQFRMDQFPPPPPPPQGPVGGQPNFQGQVYGQHPPPPPPPPSQNSSYSRGGRGGYRGGNRGDHRGGYRGGWGQRGRGGRWN